MESFRRTAATERPDYTAFGLYKKVAVNRTDDDGHEWINAAASFIFRCRNLEAAGRGSLIGLLRDCTADARIPSDFKIEVEEQMRKAAEEP